MTDEWRKNQGEMEKRFRKCEELRSARAQLLHSYVRKLGNDCQREWATPKLMKKASEAH